MKIALLILLCLALPAFAASCPAVAGLAKAVAGLVQEAVRQ